MTTRAIDESEFRAGLAQLKGENRIRDHALLVALAKTGFRITELLSVNVKDVFDQLTGEMRQRLAVPRCNIKGKVEGRSIPIHAEAQIALRELITEAGLDKPHSQAKPLFLSRKGGRLTRNQAWRIIKAAFTRCGIAEAVACHSLRKKYATDVYLRSGRCIVTTQQALGHRDPTHTAVYIAVNRERLDAAILGL